MSDYVECPECHEEQWDGDDCEFCGADLHPDTGDGPTSIPSQCEEYVCAVVGLGSRY